jgi:perosamine synthetase
MYRGVPVGRLAQMTCFSFHPVKHITTGEGGMITTDDKSLATKLTTFRNHGIVNDFRKRQQAGTWNYEMEHLGWNYRLTDVQCALGLSQLKKLDFWLERRRAIAIQYQEGLRNLTSIQLLSGSPNTRHAYHLYIVLLDLEKLVVDRRTFLQALWAEGIGVNVHYPPVHLQPYYRSKLSTKPGDCPVAEKVAERVISLPMFASMSDQDVVDVVEAVTKVAHCYAK